jgi:hypothetical protein
MGKGAGTQNGLARPPRSNPAATARRLALSAIGPISEAQGIPDISAPERRRCQWFMEVALVQLNRRHH